MKAIKLIAFIFLSLVEGMNQNSSLLVPSVKSFVKEYYSEHYSNIDLIYYGRNKSEIEGIQNKLVNGKNIATTFQIRSWIRKLSGPSILIFESVNFFSAFCKQGSWQIHSTYRDKHLVYVPNLTTTDISKHVRDGFLIDSVNFLMNVTENSIDLVSSYMFTQQTCRLNQLVTINRFERMTMKWSNSDFYPNKYKDLHGCEVFIVKYLEFFQETNSIFRIFSSLTKLINCSLQNVQYEIAQTKRDSIFDMFGFTRELRYGTIKGLALSHPVAAGKFTFFIPPGELLTQLEKMVQPFQTDSWIAIIVTLLVAFVILQVINLLPIRIQNFCYGRNIRTPTLNLIEIFLCGGQNKIPLRNFARFILMLFLWWTLIIRTCYQSDLYKYLQTDSRKPPVQSIEEMIQRNFSFVDSYLLFYLFGENYTTLPL